MRTFILLCVCIAAASAAKIHQAKERIPNSYIIMMKDGYKVDSFVNSMMSFGRQANAYINVQYRYKFMNGLAAQIPDEYVHELSKLEGIDYIEENGVVRAQAVTWGLDRIDQRGLPLDGNYNAPNDGSGVNVYIIDTGILASHNEFGGRASSAFDAVDDGRDGIDCNGHGTHCAGTIGSASYGVANNVNLFGVRVLSCEGSGTNAGVIAGMDYVAQNGVRPAVASMSLGGGASQATDDAVERMTNAGITVVVAAGNSDWLACWYSPAAAVSAITVAASDSSDVRASFSNFGSCVDIFAPGVSITSTWIGSDSATNTISGTSMACPHVAGAAALVLSANNDLSPAQVTIDLIARSTTNAISDVGWNGTPNTLLYTGQ